MTQALRQSRPLRRSWARDLDAATLYALLKLRSEVFVVEQHCPYLELDGQDLLAGTRHFWFEDADGRMVATLRLLEDNAGGSTSFRIGRVCTAPANRGRGYASRLLQAALADVGDHACYLNAQSHLAGMYVRQGFSVTGAEFLEDGIPHVPMSRTGRL